jgi:enoyl-CoA hydratase/carnithine racemase
MAAEIKSHTVASSQGLTMVLTLSNTEHCNALDPEMYAAGVEALSVAESNAEIRSVILTGEGSTFCAGGNLRRLLSNRQEPPEVQAQNIEGFHNWIETIRSFPKPVIAAVEGAAAGGGFSLALACDLMVASSTAQFVMAYSSIGLSPDGGASWHLSRCLPRQLATQLMMLGERVAATRLHELGLVHSITPPGQTLVEALALCEKLNQRAPNALASIKDLTESASSLSLHLQLQQERDHFVRNLHHSNAGEGIQAFLNKRSAQYR